MSISPGFLSDIIQIFVQFFNMTSYPLKITRFYICINIVMFFSGETEENKQRIIQGELN